MKYQLYVHFNQMIVEADSYEDAKEQAEILAKKSCSVKIIEEPLKT